MLLSILVNVTNADAKIKRCADSWHMIPHLEESEIKPSSYSLQTGFEIAMYVFKSVLALHKHKNQLTE